MCINSCQTSRVVFTGSPVFPTMIILKCQNKGETKMAKARKESKKRRYQYRYDEDVHSISWRSVPDWKWEPIKKNLEKLVTCKRLGDVPDESVSKWLQSLMSSKNIAEISTLPGVGRASTSIINYVSIFKSLAWSLGKSRFIGCGEISSRIC